MFLREAIVMYLWTWYIPRGFNQPRVQFNSINYVPVRNLINLPMFWLCEITCWVTTEASSIRAWCDRCATSEQCWAALLTCSTHIRRTVLTCSGTRHRALLATQFYLIFTVVDLAAYTYVECVLLIAGLQPHLDESDWLDSGSGWGCTPEVHEQSWHPG